MNRGDIYHLDLDPTKGREQNGRRYVLIVSPKAFNSLSGMPIVVPITTGGTSARMKGFGVNLQGAGTGVTGVIQCDQPKAVDLSARNGRFSGDKAPLFIMDEVLARLATIFE